MVHQTYKYSNNTSILQTSFLYNLKHCIFVFYVTEVCEVKSFCQTCSALSSGFIKYFPLLTTEAVSCLKWVFSRYPSLKEAMATATVVKGLCMLSQNLKRKCIGIYRYLMPFTLFRNESNLELSKSSSIIRLGIFKCVKVC